VRSRPRWTKLKARRAAPIKARHPKTTRKKSTSHTSEPDDRRVGGVTRNA